MSIRAWYFVTLLLTALLMGTSFAHTLEMPGKLTVDGLTWLTFQHTLYHYFAYVGAPVELGSIASLAWLTILTRNHRRTFYLALVAAVCFASAFGVWLGFTNTVNAETAQWTAGSLPPDWSAWRTQWEYSHAARFALHLFGFVSLLLSLISGIAGELEIKRVRFAGYGAVR